MIDAKKLKNNKSRHMQTINWIRLWPAFIKAVPVSNAVNNIIPIHVHLFYKLYEHELLKLVNNKGDKCK